MLKVLVVGCGRISQAAHLPSLVNLQNEGLVELAAVCDVNLDRAKSTALRFGVQQFDSDWESLARQIRPDLISVCLPPGPNAEISKRSLEMGIHAICEKPPGRNLQQAMEMAVAAQNHPELMSMVAFNRRFAPLYTKAIAASLKLGSPTTFYASFTRPGLGTSPSDTASDWLTSDASHSLDLAIATIGFPFKVSVARTQVGQKPDNVWGIQLYSNKGTAFVSLVFCAGRRVERFEWTGPGYDVMLELPDRGEWSQQGKELALWNASEFTQSKDSYINYGYLDEYRSLIHAIIGKGPRPEPDFTYAASFMQLIETLLQCPNGETIKIQLPDSVKKMSRSFPPEKESEKSTGSIQKKPVVLIRQPIHLHDKYFDLGTMEKIARSCDLYVAGPTEKPLVDSANVEAIVSGWDAPSLSRENLESFKKLKLLIILGSSVRSVFPDLLLEKGVMLCNTADAVAQSVAEHTLLLTLAGLRQLSKVDQKMHRGLWPIPGSITQSFMKSMVKKARKNRILQFLKPVLRPLARFIFPVKKNGSKSNQATGTGWHDLQGQTVGLIGWGHIARHFAALLQPFRCQLLICSQSVSDSDLTHFDAKRATLGEVLGASKVISLHKGLTRDTNDLLDSDQLALIRPGSVLINTSRAGLFNEKALIDRLKKGDFVAALDVFHEEPLATSHPLRKLENVILTPHMANLTPECYPRVGQQALDILLNWIDGKPIPALDASRIARMT